MSRYCRHFVMETKAVVRKGTSGHVESGQHGDPLVEYGIQIWCAHDISQRIVVGFYKEQLVLQVLFKLFGNCSLEGKELELQRVIPWFASLQPPAGMCHLMVLAIVLLLGEDCAEPIGQYIRFEQEWAFL